MTRTELADRDYLSHYEELYPVAFAQSLNQVDNRVRAAEMAEKETALAAFRIMCRTNLWFLSTEVFGMDKGRRSKRKIWYDDFQGPLMDNLGSTEDVLIWFSRNMLKTTGVEIYITQRIIDDPVNCAVMLGSESTRLARRSMQSVKRRLKHPKLLLAFPDRLIGNEQKWELSNQDMMTITRNVIDDDGVAREIPPAEPQLRVFGEDSSVTGDHPTDIVLDDFITEKNTTTAVQIQKAVSKFEAIAGLRSLDTVTKVVGTPWNGFDLYHQIKERKIIENIVQIPGVHMEGTREVIDYPWFTREFLEKQKKMMGRLYWAQMHLDTRPQEDAIFMPPYPQWSVLPENLEFFMGVDPSTGKTEEHDKSGICIGAVDKDNPSALYLIEAEAYSLKAEELAEVVLDRILQYNLSRVAIELGQQVAILALIRLKAQDRLRSVGVNLPEFVEVSTGGGSAGSKWQKIDGTFGAMMRDQRVLLSQGMDALRLQMELFDKNKQKNDDDILDAVRHCILAVPYFTYGAFKMDNTPVATPLSWKALVESLNTGKPDRSRLFSN